MQSCNKVGWLGASLQVQNCLVGRRPSAAGLVGLKKQWWFAGMETGEKNCASIYAVCILAHDGKAINISRFPSTTAWETIPLGKAARNKRLVGWKWIQVPPCITASGTSLHHVNVNHPAPQRMARILLQEAATKLASLQYWRTLHLDFYQIPSRMTMLHLCKVAQEKAWGALHELKVYWL